jgi:Helix-turn-helix domain
LNKREKIAIWRAKGLSLREVARRLGRAPGTISGHQKEKIVDNKVVRFLKEKPLISVRALVVAFIPMFFCSLKAKNF